MLIIYKSLPHFFAGYPYLHVPLPYVAVEVYQLFQYRPADIWDRYSVSVSLNDALRCLQAGNFQIVVFLPVVTARINWMKMTTPRRQQVCIFVDHTIRREGSMCSS